MSEALGIISSVGSIVGSVSSLASTMVSTAGIYQQHQQAKINARMQEKQFEYNKRLALQEEAKTERITSENVRRQRELSNQLKARQRALLGKSGAALASGSPLAVLGETAAEEELKVQDIAIAGYNRAEQLRQQAAIYDYHARVAKSSAPSDSTLALNIAGQVVKGMGNMNVGSGLGNNLMM